MVKPMIGNQKQPGGKSSFLDQSLTFTVSAIENVNVKFLTQKKGERWQVCHASCWITRAPTQALLFAISQLSGGARGFHLLFKSAAQKASVHLSSPGPRAGRVAGLG